MIDELPYIEREFMKSTVTSQKRMVIVSASNTLGLFRVRGSWHVKRFWEMVVLPSSLGLEE